MSTEITRAVVERHMTELGAGNIDAVMADYADDAIMVSNLGGLTKGAEAARAQAKVTPSAKLDKHATDMLAVANDMPETDPVRQTTVDFAEDDTKIEGKSEVGATPPPVTGH